MNIRIPYDKLGDVNSYAFVSLILDKNRSAIYREDFVNGKSDKFFSRKQQFAAVPKKVYDDCDSIIFFPFLKKTNKWGTKVIMWKNGEFEKFNGGYEYVRNSEKLPDIQKIEKWLHRGKIIKKISTPIGQKNLIYFTLFGNNEYISLQKILLNTLKSQEYQDFDLLFITDKETKSVISDIPEIKNYNVHYHVVETTNDPVDASMQKLKIYEWPNIENYNNILFLDSDIIVIGNLKNVFESPQVKHDIFYSAIHNKNQSLHGTIYHCLVDYTEYQLQNFTDKGITAFNAGQYFFKNTSAMKEHFRNINEFVSVWDGRYFFEQSFINYYFNLLEMADTKLFESAFKFVSINENQTLNIFDNKAVLVHFMGNAGNGAGKLDFIKKHYNKYL